MYWNFAGAICCLIVARYLKHKVGGNKKAYQAALILTAAFLLALIAAWMEGTKTEGNKIVRNKPGQGILEKEFQNVVSL